MNIAIFPSQGLGDGIIQLVLAQNLASLGIKIDYYHQFLADINELVPCADIYKPNKDIIENKIDHYDVILQDCGSKRTTLNDYKDRIESKLANYTMSRIKHRWYKPGSSINNPKFIAPTLIIDKKIIDLSVFNGRSLRASKLMGLSTAGSIVQFFKNHQFIDEPDYELALTLPASWQKQKHTNRILIHPTSTSDKKNWLPAQFIRLARRLSDSGYFPVFSVAPSENEHWGRLINDEFNLVVFDKFNDLAKYYYESSLHIGTDSGNGHFASALGLPTVTIVNRWSISFDWRPNWAKNIIVRPVLSKKLVGDRFWKYTVSQKLVLDSVRKIQD